MLNFQQHPISTAAARCCVVLGGGSMPFSQNLRRVRLARFLSQAELARQSGLHTLTISRLEAGRARPSTRTVRAGKLACCRERRARGFGGGRRSRHRVPLSFLENRPRLEERLPFAYFTN